MPDIFARKELNGLDDKQIPELQRQYGKNLLKGSGRHSFFRIVWDIVKEPMFLMLLVACGLYLVLGEGREALLMLAAMVLVSAISFYQELKSTKALAALKRYTASRTIVIRNENEQMILSEDLLPGDVIRLSEGDLVPADATVLSSNDLTVNEAIITGESFAAEKDLSWKNQLFQGTTIASGWCYSKVTAIGNNTVLGKIGKSILTISTPKTVLQRQLTGFVKTMAIFGAIAFLIVWVFNYLQTRNLAQSLLQGLVLAMSVLPEEIPVAFASFMALGAYRMSRSGIITKYPATIENLGSVSVICLDKTGTITENKMRLKCLYDLQNGLLEDIGDKPVLNKNVLRLARLASEKEPFDEMEKAIVAAANSDQFDAEEYKMIYEYPLAGVPPMMTHIYETNDGIIAAAKGAPERIIKICRLKPEETQKIEAMVIKLASLGYRVLGVSCAICRDRDFPQDQADLDWEFRGLVGLYDPPRSSVKSVLQTWYGAGIAIKLITGDFTETAINIAGQVGIRDCDKHLRGDDIINMPPGELQHIVKETVVFSRMYPEAKLKIIQALKANGEVVGMMGDGANDAPGLKAADIGIAMGKVGNEIAREAAHLVLTNDDLEKISEAIYEGRRVYENLKKAVRYIISIHVPIILVASVPLLLQWRYPNVFSPVHIIFLELIMGPTCSVFFEREPAAADTMKKPPRPRQTVMFSRTELLGSVLQGVIIAAGVLGLYYHAMSNRLSLEHVRTISFTALLLSNIFLTFVNRSFSETIVATVRYKNNLALPVLLISVSFMALLLFVPFAQKLFYLTRLTLNDVLLCLLVTGISTMWFEGYKYVLQKYRSKRR